jgi:membrane associated rhomboid family serine protease
LSGVTGDAPQTVHDAHTMRFLRAVLSRPATFTFVFLIANVFVFLLTSLEGAAQSNYVLVRYGAKVNALIDAGEWWRFVTPIFLHGGVAHLLMNMYGLFILGPYVEKLYGSAKFVVFWVVAGVAGVVASYLSVQPEMTGTLLGRFLFKSGDGISVGASGALFGLIGVLFVFGIKFRHELPDGFKRAFGTGMLPTILLNIFIGFAVPVIDNAAHLGGLVAGAALALFVGYKRPHQAPRVAVAWHALQIAALALVVVSFTMVALRFNTGAPVVDSAAEQAPPVVTYIKALNTAQLALVSALQGNTEPIDEALAKLNEAPALDDNANRLRDDLRAIVVRARDVAGMDAETAAAKSTRDEVAASVIKDFRAWEERQRAWLRNDARNYGLAIQEAQEKPDGANDAGKGGDTPLQPTDENRVP